LYDAARATNWNAANIFSSWVPDLDLHVFPAILMTCKRGDMERPVVAYDLNEI
jgi:hypothetical protein